IGHIDWSMPIEIAHTDEFGYRSRAQLKIDRAANKIGFYQAGSHDVCDIEVCPILAPPLNQALTELRNARDEIAASAAPYTKIELTGGDQSVSTQPSVAGFTNDAVKQRVKGI